MASGAGPRRYNYKNPRRVNLVSVGLVVLLAAAGYAGWKLVPVYWSSYKVDELVGATAAQADGIGMGQREARDKLEKQLLTALKERIAELGITPEEHGLQVYFTDGFSALHAEYDIVVEFPFDKRFTRHFDVVSSVSAGRSP
jgi:hypothetical protein